MNLLHKKVMVSVSLISILFLTQCKKETAPDNTYGLPNATESGANIFACVLNGYGTYTNFIVATDFNDPNYATSGNGAWVKTDTLIIAGAPQIGSYFQGIQFTIIGDLQQGAQYSIDSISTIATIATDSTCNGVSLYPIVSIASSGTIQLTKFDTVTKIVSGTFNCTFPPFTSCDSTVYATYGRFDYKYH
jgi:hypothetical protein